MQGVSTRRLDFSVYPNIYCSGARLSLLSRRPHILAERNWRIFSGSKEFDDAGSRYSEYGKWTANCPSCWMKSSFVMENELHSGCCSVTEDMKLMLIESIRRHRMTSRI